MKLLILSNNPGRASFRQRIGIYLPQLRAGGADCVVEKLPSHYLSRWRLYRSAANYDAVLLHKKTLNFWDAKVLRKHARKIIYDFDDAVMFSPRKPDCARSSHRRLFERTAKLSDCIIAGNAYLAKKARPFCAGVHILPTGLDITQYLSVSKPAPDGKIRLVWIGSKSTLPYLKRLSLVLDKIGGSFQNVILRIICDEFFEPKRLPVEKIPWTLDSEAANLKACDIGLSPLPDDPFTRGKCGFKLLQYFAVGLPAVASPVGVNGDFLRSSNAGFSAETDEQWFEGVCALVRDERLRVELGAKGLEFSRQFDFEVVGKRLCELILDAGK